MNGERAEEGVGGGTAECFTDRPEINPVGGNKSNNNKVLPTEWSEAEPAGVAL